MIRALPANDSLNSKKGRHQVTSHIYRGCEFPADRYYDVERDVWVRRDEDGFVTMGMTDPAQAQCGKFVHIRFKAAGRMLQRGQSAATIESAKWVGPFPTPLSGEIIATNETAVQARYPAGQQGPVWHGLACALETSPFRGGVAAFTAI